MYEALQDYVKNSELRIADENLCIRMSPELAKKYDAGDYDLAIAEHIRCVRELMALDLLPDKTKKFYIYLVPDDRLVELAMYPYKDAKGGGCPGACFDKDGLEKAYIVSQNTFVRKSGYGAQAHSNLVHEFCHLIFEEFYPRRAPVFTEGFSELIPWYVLDYDTKDKTSPGKIRYHIDSVLACNIYSADKMLGTKGVFLDKVKGERCSFQKPYISSYVFMRAIIEKIQKNYNLDKISAVKMFLSWGPKSTNNRGWLVTEFAQKLGLDAEKLLYTTEYQKEVLQKMANVVKMNQVSVKLADSIKR